MCGKREKRGLEETKEPTWVARKMYDYYLKQQKRSPRKEAKPNHHVFCFRIFLFCALVTSNIEKKKHHGNCSRNVATVKRERSTKRLVIWPLFFAFWCGSRFGRTITSLQLSACVSCGWLKGIVVKPNLKKNLNYFY